MINWEQSWVRGTKPSATHSGAARQGDSLAALPEGEMITRHSHYRKPEHRDIWRETGNECMRWGHFWDVQEVLHLGFAPEPSDQRPASEVSIISESAFLKQSFVFTDDCPVTSVKWGWEVPKQMQYQKSKNRWLHCLSGECRTKKLNQMNERVREKEKAELLLYKGNSWEGKVSFRRHQEARAWSQGYSFHECGAQHFRSPAPWFYTRAQHIQISNLYSQEGRKACRPE